MITNEMWQRAKEAFEYYPTVDTFYFTSDLDYSDLITTASIKADILGDRIFHTITRKQVEEHFKEVAVYQPEICNKPLCRCVEIAELKNGGNPVKSYPCLAKIDPDQLKSSFVEAKPITPADLVKSEAVAFAEWIEKESPFVFDYKSNLWHFDIADCTTSELYNIYLTSKQAK